jgi:hypothetical protein
MPRYITLNLVNEQGTPHPWPGTATPFEIGSQVSVLPVWIGVSADGSDNQIFPDTADAQTILQSWPHLYKGIQINQIIPGDDSPGEVGPGEFVYYVSLTEFNRLVAACCIADQVDESPTESPSEPISQEMMFAFSSSQLGGCEAEQTPYYVSADADPDDMTGEAIFTDPELTDPVPENGPYVIVNGRVYNYGEEDPANAIGTLVGVCAEFSSMRFDVNLGAPAQTVDFRFIFAPSTQQFFVDWGDGSALEEYNGTDVIPEHEYADAGEYQVRVHMELGGNLLQTIELLNHPLTYFGFHPEFGGALSMQTLLVQNCGLTDAALDAASFYNANINTIILADNQLTAAILAQLTEQTLTLNLNNNNLGDVVLADGPEALSNLFANNAGVDSFDGSDFLTSSLNDLQLANNGLETFDIAELSLSTLTSLILNGNSLPVAEVDAILEALDTAGNTGGIVNLSGQTPAAPPGAGGLAAQANLELDGWTVTVDA